jgi:hypothetical protein
MPDTPAPSTPPGWYDDPHDPTRLRYFDGAAWTDRTAAKDTGALAPSTPPPAGQPPKKSSKVALFGCLGLVLLLFAGCYAMINSSSGSGGGGGGGDSAASLEAGAWVVCKDQVTSQLKSPATAGFPMMSEFNINTSGSTYTMNAWVDSENGFGAQIRTGFTCKAVHTGGDSYRVTVTFDDQ